MHSTENEPESLVHEFTENVVRVDERRIRSDALAMVKNEKILFSNNFGLVVHIFYRFNHVNLRLPVRLYYDLDKIIIFLADLTFFNQHIGKTNRPVIEQKILFAVNNYSSIGFQYCVIQFSSGFTIDTLCFIFKLALRKRH